MTTVKIAGREFPLAFTLASMMEMEKRIDGYSFGDLNEIIGRNNTMVKVLHILAETAAKLDGKKLDEDEEWFALHIPANMKKLISIRIRIMDALAEGMEMEAEEDGDDKEVDAILEKIQKKSLEIKSHGDGSQPGG